MSGSPIRMHDIDARIEAGVNTEKIAMVAFRQRVLPCIGEPWHLEVSQDPFRKSDDIKRNTRWGDIGFGYDQKHAGYKQYQYPEFCKMMAAYHTPFSIEPSMYWEQGSAQHVDVKGTDFISEDALKHLHRSVWVMFNAGRPAGNMHFMVRMHDWTRDHIVDTCPLETTLWGDGKTQSGYRVHLDDLRGYSGPFDECGYCEEFYVFSAPKYEMFLLEQQRAGAKLFKPM